MIAAWMLYALLVSALVAAAGWLLEGVVRLRGGPVRFVWIAALAVTVALVATAPARRDAPVTLPAATAGTARVEPVEIVEAHGLAAMAGRIREEIRSAMTKPLDAAAALGAGSAGQALGMGWMALTALGLGAMGLTLARARHVRRRWPRAHVAGEGVRIAPRTGPAVLGIVRPEVVVPVWLLDAPVEEQRLVVMHEREHVRARDPLMLVGGCALVALLPWSPAAWWMLLRLRAAVEMDCDARVLRRGVKPAAYGTLLIDMAGRSPGLALGAPAMAGWPSTLERRLRAMDARLPRFARTRAGLLGALALAALAGACESALPTTAEVEKMDVNAMESRVGQLQIAETGVRTYYVDDVRVSADEARALSADRIVRVEVKKGADGGGEVRVYTRPGAAGGESAVAGRAAPRVEQLQITEGTDGRVVLRGQAAGQPFEAEGERVTVHVARDGRPDSAVFEGSSRGVQAATFERGSGRTPDEVRVTTTTTGQPVGIEGNGPGVRVGSTNGFDGLLVVDGQVRDASALQSIDPGTIESIDVLKGTSATTLYSDPRAVNGVIRVTTKAAARH